MDRNVSGLNCVPRHQYDSTCHPLEISTPEADGVSLSRSLLRRSHRDWVMDVGVLEANLLLTECEGLQAKGYFPFCEVSCCDYGTGSWL